MEDTEAPKNLAKYSIKKKAGSDLEFEESSPFFHGDAAKILGGSEQVNQCSRFTSFFAIILIGVLALQTFRMQIIDRNEFSSLAENNHLKEVTTRADRGIIYDKNKKILVRNRAIFDLMAMPREISRDPKTIGRIAGVTGRDIKEIDNALKKIDYSSYKAVLVLDNLDTSQAIALQSDKDKMQGFIIKNNSIREYFDAGYFSHIIGYTGRVSPDDLERDNSYEISDFIGKDGLESYYEAYLKGEKGVKIHETDATGKTISVSDKNETKTGGNLVLSIDADLQKKLQDSLSDMLKKLPAKLNNTGAAAAVAMDPRNGKILAIVSLPAYDNNIFADPKNKSKIGSLLLDPKSSMLNRAISGVYPPGSTIKPVMGTAALQEGIINRNTTIEDRGVISAHGTNYFGWDHSGLGSMNIISALTQSSDIFFYTVGGGYGNFKGLGPDKIAEYFRKFNLGSVLGIDLPGEAGGTVPTPKWKKEKFDEPWSVGNTYHISIGQGYLLTTPLQVASWTSTIANGGTIYKPYVVDKVISSVDDSAIKEFGPQIITERVADKKYIDIIRQGMREVVADSAGSGRGLKNLKVAVAGKTGTAEFGEDGNTHAWFTSFAPYDNPEIVLTVLIESGGEGGINSVPVAKEVLSWYFEDK